MFSTTLVSEKIMFAPFGLACLLTFELQVKTVQVVYSLSKTFRSPVPLSHLPCTQEIIMLSTAIQLFKLNKEM